MHYLNIYKTENEVFVVEFLNEGQNDQYFCNQLFKEIEILINGINDNDINCSGIVFDFTQNESGFHSPTLEATNAMLHAATDSDPVAIFDEIQSNKSLMRELELCQTPIIAVVDGKIACGDWEMVLIADYVFAAESTYFTMDQLEFGLIPQYGGLERVMCRIGFESAFELLHNTQCILVDQAHHLGFIDKVFKDMTQALEQAIDWIYEAEPVSRSFQMPEKPPSNRNSNGKKHGFNSSLDATNNDTTEFEVFPEKHGLFTVMCEISGLDMDAANRVITRKLITLIKKEQARFRTNYLLIEKEKQEILVDSFIDASLMKLIFLETFSRLVKSGVSPHRLNNLIKIDGFAVTPFELFSKCLSKDLKREIKKWANDMVDFPHLLLLLEQVEDSDYLINYLEMIENENSAKQLLNNQSLLQQFLYQCVISINLYHDDDLTVKSELVNKDFINSDYFPLHRGGIADFINQHGIDHLKSSLSQSNILLSM